MAGFDLPHTALSRPIDRCLTAVGRASMWLWLLLVVVILINVVMRHLFGEGRVELEELQWHINAVGFLLAICYGFQVDAHIRVDVVAHRLAPRTRAWLELYGILLLLLPFIALVLWFSVPFVTHSFNAGEVSQAPGGLGYRWLIKAMLPIAFTLLLAAALSRLSRVWRFLATGEHA